MFKKFLRSISNLLILIVFTFFSFFLSEVLIRIIDGYPIFRIKLEGKRASFRRGQIPMSYLKRIPLNEDTDLELFFKTPPVVPREKPDSFWETLYNNEKNKGTYGSPNSVIKEWNKFFIIDQIEKGEFNNSIFRDFPPEAVTFEPCEKSIYPCYRFPRSVTLPTGLVTNNFGWRGHWLTLNKPEDTIRICFLGASTTIGIHKFPYSYPEFIEYWLNLWAKKKHLKIKFEIMNTAREAISSSDIEAIFRQEAFFLEPDFLIYYEGANNFYHYVDLLKNVKKSIPKFDYQERGFLILINKIESFSALGRRVKELFLKIDKRRLLLSEPLKPDYILEFPSGIKEDYPDITKENLPLGLNTILKNLDSIQKVAKEIECQFVLTSFVWLPYKGMLLNRAYQQLMYEYINQTYWPLTYNDIKRLADFQNRVFSLYAKASHIDFIDLASFYPKDPDLFVDSVHFTEEGTRLQAWIIFQGLLPMIKKGITSGRLPRDDKEYLREHPCIREGIRNGFAVLKEVAKRRASKSSLKGFE